MKDDLTETGCTGSFLIDRCLLIPRPRGRMDHGRVAACSTYGTGVGVFHPCPDHLSGRVLGLLLFARHPQVDEMESLKSLDEKLLSLYRDLKTEKCLLRRETIAIGIRETQAELRVRRSNPKPWWLRMTNDYQP